MSLMDDFEGLKQGFGTFRARVKAGLARAQEPERQQLETLSQALDEAFREVEKTFPPMAAAVDQQLAGLQTSFDQTGARLATLQKQLDDLVAKAAHAQPAPPPPPRPLVPGEGDPAYGEALSTELLGLIGIGPKAADDGTKQPPKSGDVWELESVDWVVDN